MKLCKVPMKRQQIISAFLFVLMVITLVPKDASAYYSETTDPTAVDSLYDNEIPMDKIIETLSTVERSKDAWGLSDVDFENLYIGSPIHSYTYSDESVAESALIYPISMDNRLLLLAIYYNDSITITTEFVNEINDTIGFDEPFSIINDSCGCYVYTSNSCIPLSEYGIDSEEEPYTVSPKNTAILAERLALTALADNQLLPYTSALMQYANDSSYFYTCNVPLINQLPDKNICWAACVASIVNYRQGTALTAQDVAKSFYGTDYNQGLNIKYISDVLKRYGIFYVHDHVYPTDYQIFINLSSRFPVYSRWIREDWPNHACLIFGIDSQNRHLSLMDPMRGIRSTAESNGHDYYYYCIELAGAYKLGAGLLHTLG